MSDKLATHTQGPVTPGRRLLPDRVPSLSMLLVASPIVPPDMGKKTVPPFAVSTNILLLETGIV